MKTLVTVALVLVLSGCVNLPPDFPHSTGASTQPETLWGRAMARYSERQHAALEYAKTCDAAFSAEVKSCDVVVDEMAEIDDLAAAVQKDGEQALLRQDLPRLNQAIKDLDAVGDEMVVAMRGTQ
jgi:hypothetical protein